MLASAANDTSSMQMLKNTISPGDRPATPPWRLSFHPSRPPSRTRQVTAMSLIFIAEPAQSVSCKPPHLGNAGSCRSCRGMGTV
jgi:hypothetical protein